MSKQFTDPLCRRELFIQLMAIIRIIVESQSFACMLSFFDKCAQCLDLGQWKT